MGASAPAPDNFRLSLRLPAIWTAVWLMIIVAGTGRLGWLYLPLLLAAGVALIGVGIWANAGPGIVLSLEDRGPSLVVRQWLGGSEEFPWADVTEAAVIQRQDKLMLYPLLRLKDESGRTVFLPLHLLDNPQGLKKLVQNKANLEPALPLDAGESERWVRAIDD